jgi:hypothetical protein
LISDNGSHKTNEINEAEDTNDKNPPKASKQKVRAAAASSFFDFIRAAYETGRIPQENKAAFAKFDINLSDKERLEIVEVATIKDTELRTTLSLAEFVLEGGEYSRNHEILFGLVENIVSNYASLANVKTNTIFQSWLDGARTDYDKFSFFVGQIDALTIPSENGESRPLPDSKKNNLICIAAIWLYRKRQAGFSDLIRYLSRTAFTIRGEAGAHIESNAFGFAASMITSTKKAKFAYFLSQISNDENKLKQKLAYTENELLRAKKLIADAKNSEEQLKEALHQGETRIAKANEEISVLTQEVERSRQYVKHTEIHLNDSKDDLRVKVLRSLDEDLRSLLLKAEIANSRSKAEIVDYLLKSGLETIDREVAWLKQ